MGASALINLHTHTRYSDGDHLPDDVVRSAYSAGLRAVGISDHFMTSKVPSPLTKEEFPRYLRHLRSLGAMYEGKMRVLAGVEIDANRQRGRLDELPFEMLDQLDFVLFEYAEDPSQNGISLRELGAIRRKISAPCGLCHWDMDRIFQDAAPEALAETLHALDLFVEVSTSDYYTREGLHFYELGERFFHAFRGQVKVSIGTDSHRRLSEVGNIGRGVEFVERLGLLDQLVI
ncbi:MAG: PHP domain-containing protein [Methanomassiliicoccales archaeon]